MIYVVFFSLLLIAVSVINTNVFAQTKVKTAMMKDCCMMKDGKMMH